jgi:hypothetical protein
MCGYNKNLAALDFHHVTPEDKKFLVSQNRYSFSEETMREIDKCLLLCANCHRELTHPEFSTTPQEALLLSVTPWTLWEETVSTHHVPTFSEGG